MWKPLELAEHEFRKSKRRKHKIYEYMLTDEHTAIIRVIDEDDAAEAIVDVETIERMKNDVYQLYVLRDGANKPRILLGCKGNKKILLSRYVMNAPKGLVVDHKNGNPLDNRKENLRVVDHRTNLRNRKNWNKATGKRGVRRVRRPDGKIVYHAVLYVGTFDTPEEAERAYYEAYKKVFPDALLRE